jgi:predicted Zn-dependent protease
MAIALVMLSVFCIFSFAEAKDYGHYNLKHDLKRIITVSDTTSEKQTSIHLDSLDQILTDLSSHARSYPPTFDTSKDRERAVEDVKTLSVLLDVLVNGPNPHPKLLLRAGFLNSMGHNLDIPGTAEKANSNFQRLLTISPSDPHVNYHYGTFLAGTAKPREALPYLEKAFAAGVRDAAYGLGMTYLVLGDKHKAIEHLEAYRQHRPQDDVVAKLIDDIRNGRFEIKWSRVTEGSSR